MNGSVIYSEIFASGLVPGGNAAVNGLSVNGSGQVVLGNDVGGTSAKLLNNREIPLNAFGVLFSGMNAPNPAFTFKQAVSPLNSPTFLWQTSAGVEIGRLTIKEGESVYLGRNAGASVTTGNVNILIGGNAGGGLLTGSSNICIGGGAMQGNSGASAFNICIGQDSLDRNTTGTIGAGIVVVGHLSTNNGTQPVGNDNIFLGNSNNSTGTAASGIGIDNIILGHANVMGGNLNNSIIIGNLKNGGAGAEMTVSNVIIIGRTDQNTLINPVLPIVDNGSRLQVNGSISLPIVSTAVNLALDGTHHTVIVTAGSTITQPAAAAAPGRIYVIVALAAVTMGVAYTNLAGASVTPIAAGNSVMMQSNGVSWFQIK
jgi:hypothetical protein